MPGQPGAWWMEAKKRLGSASTTAWVPLPWWTSKSTIATRARPVGLRRARGDGDVGEQAKAHGPVRLGVVAGRADGAEGPLDLAARHRAHRVDHRAGGAPGGGEAARRHQGVRVEAQQALGGRGGEQRLDEARGRARCRVRRG